MSRDYKREFEERVAFIRGIVESSGAKGIVFGNSGGKDCALVGILCKAACENTLSLMLPCLSKRNFTLDIDDAKALTEQFNIEYRVIDVTPIREAVISAVKPEGELSSAALANIAPRLRMTALYTVAADEGRLVAGTGNRSETYMGYFTKWGDGASDFNPISDLTVTEVYEFLRYLNAPKSIIDKAPSAALFEGQTDEKEMGVTYAAIDRYIFTGEAEPHDREIIERFHSRSQHKREPIKTYK